MADFQDHPTAVRLGEELDAAKLELFLRGHFRNEAGAMRVEQFPNGHSNLTYAIHFGEEQFVLRRPPWMVVTFTVLAGVAVTFLI